MATIWTQADIDSLKSAIASGVLTVNFDGPPRRSITYQNLAQMEALLARMVRDVNGTAGNRYRRAQFSKGFR